VDPFRGAPATTGATQGLRGGSLSLLYMTALEFAGLARDGMINEQRRE